MFIFKLKSTDVQTKKIPNGAGARESILDDTVLSLLWRVEEGIFEGVLSLWLSGLQERRLLHQGRLHRLPLVSRVSSKLFRVSYCLLTPQFWILIFTFILYILIQAAILHGISPEVFESATSGTHVGTTASYAMAIYFSFISDTTTCTFGYSSTFFIFL